MCVHGIPLGIVENVCDRTLPLLAGDEFFGADAIPLASVAKAIEDFRECQILFVPHEFPHQQYSHLFTHKLKLVFLDSAGKETLTRDSEESEELSWLRHSIFYLPASNRRDQQELLRERWYVLHELGHIWLHWSDNNRPECEENVDWIPDGDGHQCICHTARGPSPGAWWAHSEARG